MAKVDSVLHQCLALDYDADVPVHIFVTQDMVRDLKDLRFGWNQDLSFETCHRGVSPFAVVAVSQENAAIQRILCRHIAIYQGMSPQDVAQLLWAIFMDARIFYSNTAGDPLPKSDLVMLQMLLGTGSVKTSLNCPVQRLLGMAPGHTVVTDEASLASGMSSLSDGILVPIGGQRSMMKTNAHYHPKLAAAMAPLVAKHPMARLSAVINAGRDPLKFADIRIGVNGSCLDMHYLGRCTAEGCNYKHGNVGQAADDHVQKILPRLKKATVEYMAMHG
jgi:hypothetical protein